jgi:hypothetical protein
VIFLGEDFEGSKKGGLKEEGQIWWEWLEGDISDASWKEEGGKMILGWDREDGLEVRNGWTGGPREGDKIGGESPNMSMANGELPKATEEISDAIKTPLPRSVGDAGLTEERVLAARDVAASCPSICKYGL